MDRAELTRVLQSVLGGARAELLANSCWEAIALVEPSAVLAASGPGGKVTHAHTPSHTLAHAHTPSPCTPSPCTPSHALALSPFDWVVLHQRHRMSG